MTYSIGNIYKIICTIDSNFCYIGATFNQLRHRFQGHKYKFKKWLKDKNKNYKCSIYAYFEKYGIENFKIILIKSYNVVRTNQRDNKHLHAYELLWINKTKNCVNEALPFNPLYKLDRKESKKEYNENNKEKIKQQTKEKYQENKESISAKNKKKFICACGSTIRITHKARHEKTKKHIQFCEKK
jgi:hypothetical protein